MVGAGDEMTLPTFVTDDPCAAGTSITLGEEAAHHMRVRRLDSGVRVRLLDGAGGVGEGVLTLLAKRHATVYVDQVTHIPPSSPIHLLVPVADKDRMLWLAEKATELEVTSWRPVVYRRSRHVTPRGEGPTFQQRVRARMAAALEQSGGAWAPTVYPEAPLDAALAASPSGVRIALSDAGPPILSVLAEVTATQADGTSPVPVILALGPEGGLETSELDALQAVAFRTASLGRTTLRFETAAIAALATVRSVAVTIHGSGGRVSR